MGILDRFRNKKGNDIPIEQTPILPYKISYCYDKYGHIQIDFYDKQADFKQFYDTTRLIINCQKNLANALVYDCNVSWYGENDAIMLNGGEEIGRRVNYENVEAELDIEQLLSNQEYCSVVMKKLLNKKRVDEYLARGMQEDENVPCGKYIGGVRPREDGQGYEKIFQSKLGFASHYSQEMIIKRQQYRQQEELRRQEAINNKKMQMERLQQEINGLQK